MIAQESFSFPAVPPADLDRIEGVFRDLSQSTGEPAYLSFASFKRDVFANFLPEKLAVVCRNYPSLLWIHSSFRCSSF